MVTSDTPAILPSDTLGSYEKKDEINDSPTKARTARSIAANRNRGQTATRRMIQKRRANAHAVWVAAIDIGADRASNSKHTCMPRLVNVSIVDLRGIGDVTHGP